MDQIGSGVNLLFLLVLVVGFIVISAVVIIQLRSKKNVDHTVAQSAPGVLLDDPATIEKKLILEDKIEPLIPVRKDQHDQNHEIKFR